MLEQSVKLSRLIIFLDCKTVRIFCVFKYARAVKEKVWNEAENRERGWGSRGSRASDLRHALPISLLILRKKTTVLQSIIFCLSTNNARQEERIVKVV